MSKGKDTKQNEKQEYDVNVDFGQGFFQDRMTLPASIKAYLKEKDLDFRFLNSREFRMKGNIHRSHWQPFKVPAELQGQTAVNAEGVIARGDLILGVRPKYITQKHREHLAEKNARLAGYTKQKAKELRADAKKAGVGFTEGYDDEETGFS